jgi:hypothetical protein
MGGMGGGLTGPAIGVGWARFIPRVSLRTGRRRDQFLSPGAYHLWPRRAGPRRTAARADVAARRACLRDRGERRLAAPPTSRVRSRGGPRSLGFPRPGSGSLWARCRSRTAKTRPADHVAPARGPSARWLTALSRSARPDFSRLSRVLGRFRPIALKLLLGLCPMPCSMLKVHAGSQEACRCPEEPLRESG